MTAIDQALVLFRFAAGLLVDLDGTLADSSAPVRRAWTAFALSCCGPVVRWRS